MFFIWHYNTNLLPLVACLAPVDALLVVYSCGDANGARVAGIGAFDTLGNCVSVCMLAFCISSSL